MAELLLLSTHPIAADALRHAVRIAAADGAFHAVRSARSWTELAAWATAPGAGLVIVDPYHGGPLASAEIRRLRERAPAVEVVALADFTRRPAADAFSLALLGVREIICASGRDVARDLAAAVRTHLNRSPLDALIDEMADRVPPSIRRWLDPFLLASDTLATVPEMARAARCSPRTLRRTLHAAGLPSPEALLAWRRLLHAARLLDDGRSADSVARTLGCSSGSALRKSLKQRTGLRPRDLRAGEWLATVATLFARQCGEDAPLLAAAGG